MSDLSPATREAMNRTGPWHRPETADVELRKWCAEQSMKLVVVEIAGGACTGSSVRDYAQKLYDWVTQAAPEPAP